MAIMRAQVSLQFDDPDLFDNFITPCKEERRLNGIIVKCLKAYYTDERVRNMVEGAVPAEDASEEVASTQSICDSIRASLIMQDFLVEELKQTVDTGMEDVEDILSQANQRAEHNGFGASYQTKSGSTILQLEAAKQETPKEQPSQSANAPATGGNDLAAILCQAVLLLAKDSNNSQVTALLQQVGFTGGVSETPVMVETQRQTSAPQVEYSAGSAGGGFVEEAPVVELEPQNDFESGPAQAEDASDAMADLLGSL